MTALTNLVDRLQEGDTNRARAFVVVPSLVHDMVGLGWNVKPGESGDGEWLALAAGSDGSQSTLHLWDPANPERRFDVAFEQRGKDWRVMGIAKPASSDSRRSFLTSPDVAPPPSVSPQ